MSDLLLSEGATNKAKEADHFAFLISDVVIPDGTPRLDVVASLADAGIYTTEDDLVYGMDESDSRNERMLIKAVGHLGDSNHCMQQLMNLESRMYGSHSSPLLGQPTLMEPMP